MDLIEEKISSYIAQNILFSNNGYPYSKDASFLEHGILDSMTVLEMVLFVEENFGINVSDNDIVPDNFDSVERLAGFVRSMQ